jgi:hypothetical protein
MSIRMKRCVKHGICSHKLIAFCELCAAEYWESAPSATTNSGYMAALLQIRKIVRGRGDSVTKLGKVSDVFAGLNLPKAADCA